MSTYSAELSFEIYDDNGNEKVAKVEVEMLYERCNDGIGGYEYWGFRGYDKGEDYTEYESVEPLFPDNCDLTEKERQQIIDMISNDPEYYYRKLEEHAKDEAIADAGDRFLWSKVD